MAKHEKAKTALELNRQSAAKFADRATDSLMRETLQKAERDLSARLRARVARGAGDTFTATQMETALVQIRAVLKDVKLGIKDTTLDSAAKAAEVAAEGAVRFMTDAEAGFKGIAQPLAIDEVAVMERAVSGANSSALHRLLRQGRPDQTAGILNRYGENVVLRFEEQLQIAVATRKPWSEVRDALVGESPFLQQAPAHWAERIVRTETMAAYNRADWESMKQLDEDLGDVVKVLSATFDDRTYPDSFNVHGEIRRLDEAFEYIDYKGRVEGFVHPPNRPNDREIVVSHRLSWGAPPPYLRPKVTKIVAAEYARRKMVFHGRPTLSTIDPDEFG